MIFRILNVIQVEPLHFTCHAASDGTKMENIGPGMSTINIGPTLYDNTATTNSGASDVKMVHYTYVSIPCVINSS